MLRINLAISAVLVFALSGASFSQNDAQQEWKKKLAERRSEKAQQTAAQEQAQKAKANESELEDDSGSITINGKVIKTKKRKTAPTPAQKPPTTAAPGVQSASGVVSGATSSVTKRTQTAPAPTPAMVKIKKTKIIGGKILTVEIEVTPTPGPAASDNPIEATAVAEAPVPSATGYMLEVLKNLQGATKSPTGSLRFNAKMIATLREEFMKRKNEPLTAKVVGATRAVKIQSDLQRLSSIARGGNIDAEMADILLKVLFPTPPKETVPKNTVQGTTLNEEQSSAEAPSEQPAEEAVPAETEGQPQYYVDPQTGQYYYSDGTPVYSTEPQEVQYYYDQEGNLYYEQDGQIYYLEDQ